MKLRKLLKKLNRLASELPQLLDNEVVVFDVKEQSIKSVDNVRTGDDWEVWIVVGEE